MLDLGPIKTRLECINLPLCYQEDPVRGDWLVMAGSRVMAICRYPQEAMVFAHYGQDVCALLQEVERLQMENKALAEALGQRDDFVWTVTGGDNA